MNRNKLSQSDRILKRMYKARTKRQSAARLRCEKALSVAHDAWHDFALQLPGNTQEEQDFNVASCEFKMSSWLAFCLVYSEEVTAIDGPTW